MKTLDLLTLKHSLKRSQVETNICNNIIEKINQIPNFQEFKTNPEMIKLICNAIENEVYHNSLKKVNKKEMALNIFKRVFEINEQEEKIIDDSIEFLHANKQIRLISTSKIVIYNIGDWFSRKFL